MGWGVRKMYKTFVFITASLIVEVFCVIVLHVLKDKYTLYSMLKV